MKLTLDSLRESGAFVGAPVEREISWEQGGDELTATVFVRPMSYNSTRSEIVATHKNNDALAARISACICDEKGNAVFAPEDITGESDPERGPLNGNLVYALLNVIGEVNGMGKSQAKSTRKKNSGTS